jgi:hypothetical protein
MALLGSSGRPQQSGPVEGERRFAESETVEMALHCAFQSFELGVGRGVDPEVGTEAPL